MNERFLYGLAVAAIVLAATTANAAITTLNPSSDYYINPNGTTPTGNDSVFDTTQLRAGHFASGNTTAPSQDLRIFITFDLSGIPAGSTITSADFRLFHASTGNNTDQYGEGFVHVITGSGVDATFGTHDDTFAATSGKIVTPAHQGENTYHQISVTADIQNWLDGSVANHGFMVRSTEGFGLTGKLFRSAEAASDPPELVIEYIPEPTAVALLAAGGLGVLLRRRRVRS